MSKTLCFYKVSPAKAPLQDIVDLDAFSPSYSYVREKDADTWQKEIGILATFKQTVKDPFLACQKHYGKSATSARWERGSGWICYDKKGTEIGFLSNEIMNKYGVVKTYQGYAYNMDLISETDYYYGEAFGDGFVTYDVLIEKARSFIQEIEESWCGDSICQALFAIMKAAFTAKDGIPVVCIYE